MLYAHTDKLFSLEPRAAIARIGPSIAAILSAQAIRPETADTTAFFIVHDEIKQKLIPEIGFIQAEAVAQTVSLALLDEDYSVARVLNAVSSLLDVTAYVRVALTEQAMDKDSYNQVLLVLKSIRTYVSGPANDAAAKTYNNDTPQTKYSVLQALERMQTAHQGLTVGIAQCEPLSAVTTILLNSMSDIIAARAEVLNVRESLLGKIEGHAKIAIYCLDLGMEEETPFYLDISATYSNLGHVVLQETGKKYYESSLQEWGQKSLSFSELLVDLWAIQHLPNTEITNITNTDAEQWLQRIEQVLQYTNGFNKTIWPQLRLIMYNHDLVFVSNIQEMQRRMALFERLSGEEYKYVSQFNEEESKKILICLDYVRNEYAERTGQRSIFFK